MLPVELNPPGGHFVARKVNDRKVAHYVAEGDEDGELEADAEGEGELDGVFDTDAEGDGDEDGDVDLELEGEVDGLLDAEADEMIVPRFPSRSSQR